MAVSAAVKVEESDNKKQKCKNEKLHEISISKRLLNSEVYDADKLEDIYRGITQNIIIEMEKKHMNLSVLSYLSTIDTAHLSRLLNDKVHIGLPALIKIASALELSPTDLFPYDTNRRKTNGQRYDELTKGLDVASSNFLLGMCADYVKEHDRLTKGRYK